ncbi:pentapeptide repeat-containing protein [Haloarcula sp. GH36]|uniref:pentapeptide repeat-containing protein n=1 Tax=Haloarcula montana TaxID=3111776 RepID=UPI002D76EBB9|nr:pentapeptide repeat-containing protein [Haloarcula sp. GH36]
MPDSDVSRARAVLTRSPQERENEGIGTEAVQDALRTVLRHGTADEKTFEGCTFPALNLDYEVVHGADNHPAVFENCTFEEGISAEKADIDMPLRFHDCTIGNLFLYHARFEYDVEFDGSTFGGTVQADETRFEQDAEFDDAVFEDTVDLIETGFYDDTSFVDARFEAPASFRGSQFEGESNELDDNVSFAGAVFEAETTFEQAHFEANRFDGATFQAPVVFTEVLFDHDTEFEGVVFEADATFDEIECNEDADFSDTHWQGTVQFRGAVFNGGARTMEDDASFEGATFEGETTFTEAQFRYSNFTRTTFEADTTFQETRFRGDADFTEARFSGLADFDETRFHQEALFTDSVFDGQAHFRGAEFEGHANQLEQNVSFDRARFADAAEFTGAKFRSVSFDDTEFAATMDFSGTDFTDDALFLLRAVGDDPYVNFTDASIQGGSITQPTEGWVRYDFTRVSLGDIDLSAERERDYRELFDYFRFCETIFDEFDGNEFDFEAHTDYLDRNEWNIHTFQDPVERSYAIEMTPEAIEATYLRAKNSASAAGDMKAAGEFRVKRQQYARKKHINIALDGSAGTTARAKNGIRAVENAFLGISCGYGMRIFRIFGVFAITPAVFSLFYAFGGQVFATSATQPASVTAALTTPEGQAAFYKLVSFSYISFLTIGYGNIGPVGWGARILVAVEVYLSVILSGLVLYALIKRSEM